MISTNWKRTKTKGKQTSNEKTVIMLNGNDNGSVG